MEKPEYIEELPAVIPVFPLPNATLLPRCGLPLNIFEPRYLAMIRDAMAGNKIIGMIQPKDGVIENWKPELFQIGCAGYIETFEETGDGRFEITLRGICRFRIAAELDTTTDYRQINADWSDFSNDLKALPNACGLDRERLFDVLSDYLNLRGLEAKYDGIEAAPDDVLLNTLAMIIPFEPAEKQALIESPDILSREELLVDLLKMAVAGSNAQYDNEKH